MSGIVGVWNKDGAPVGERLMEALMAPLAFRGPDGSGVWLGGDVALGFQAFWTTPEGRGIVAPVVRGETGGRLATDGRVDAGRGGGAEVRGGSATAGDTGVALGAADGGMEGPMAPGVASGAGSATAMDTGVALGAAGGGMEGPMAPSVGPGAGSATDGGLDERAETRTELGGVGGRLEGAMAPGVGPGAGRATAGGAGVALGGVGGRLEGPMAPGVGPGAGSATDGRVDAGRGGGAEVRGGSATAGDTGVALGAGRATDGETGMALGAGRATGGRFGNRVEMRGTPGAVIVMDGRLDNRAELVAELGMAAGVSDADVVLAAYGRWGEACPERLDGDFAIAIWDPAARRLFCVRDRFGVAPFYYADLPGVFVFASELNAVLAHPAVGARVNEGMLAEVLANQIYSGTETLYAAVSRLEHRHCLTVTASGTRGRCYWEPDVAEARYRSDGECAEECLGLLRDAVARRLRVVGPVSSHLSGGLDSSAITALIAGLMPPGEILTYSNVYPGFATDETPFIDLTAGRYPVQSSRVAFQPPGPDYYREWTRRYRDFPGYPNGNALLDGLAKRQRADGVRVVLGGQGGNQLFDGYPSIIADDLGAMRLGSFWRNVRGYTYGGASPWRTAWGLGVRPLLPKPAWLRQALGRPGPSVFPLHPDFAKRVAFGDRVERPWPWRPFGSRARRDVAQYLISASNAHSSEQVTRAAAHYGIEERTPFFDRRLAEFAIRLPETYRQRDGLWKYILRRAVTDILPREVAWRQIQAEFSGPAKQVVDSQELPSLDLLEGYVDPAFLKALREGGGARTLIHRPGMGVIRKWALLGVAYFLENH